MEQNSTLNHLIRHMYKELSAFETLDLLEALNQDKQLRRAQRQLLEAYRLLPKVTFSPSQKSLNHILSYSEQTAIEAF